MPIICAWAEVNSAPGVQLPAAVWIAGDHLWHSVFPIAPPPTPDLARDWQPEAL